MTLESIYINDRIVLSFTTLTNFISLAIALFCIQCQYNKYFDKIIEPLYKKWKIKK